MLNTVELLTSLFDYLNLKVKYAVLRNFEDLPASNTSRDIDIVIEKQELDRHKTAIHDLIGESGWQIITYYNDGRLITYVCGTIMEHGVELVQLDFFTLPSVHGITLIEARESITSRVFNGRVFHVTEEYEFLDKYLYNRAVGAPFPEKYLALRCRVADSKIVKKKLKELFGSDDLDLIDQMKGKQLLVRALQYNLRTRFFTTVKRVTNSLFLYGLNYFHADVAPRLGFTGPDGAGKTTVIELLHQAIAPVFGKATEFYHFRPTLLPNLGEAVNSAGIKKEVDREFHKPHRGSKKGRLNSFARLCYYTLDYIIGFWLKVKPHGRLTKFIIFDRYYTDIIADSRRSSIHLNTNILYLWGKFFVPALDYNVLLTANPEIILFRKQELDRDGIVCINNKLSYLSTKKGYFMVLNNDSPEQAVQQILEIVFEGQHRKNLKRLEI